MQPLQAATPLIKLAIAQSVAHLPATTAAKRVTSAVSAMHHRKRSPVIAVVRPAISLVNAPPLVEQEEVWEADTLEEEVAVARNATSVARLATSLAIATRVVPTVEEDMAEGVPTEEVTAQVQVVAKEARRATLAEGTATCRATALKGKSATIVRETINLAQLMLTISGGEVGHLSRDCPSEPSSERVCYKCKQPGHVQAACPN